MTAIVTAPRPAPRTIRDADSSQSEGAEPASAKASVPATVSARPGMTTRRGPTRSVSFPARVRGRSEPMPCGASSRPVIKALLPWTSW